MNSKSRLSKADVLAYLWEEHVTEETISHNCWELSPLSEQDSEQQRQAMKGDVSARNNSEPFELLLSDLP